MSRCIPSPSLQAASPAASNRLDARFSGVLYSVTRYCLGVACFIQTHFRGACTLARVVEGSGDVATVQLKVPLETTALLVRHAFRWLPGRNKPQIFASSLSSQLPRHSTTLSCRYGHRRVRFLVQGYDARSLLVEASCLTVVSAL
jgi:hypothetical protein